MLRRQTRTPAGKYSRDANLVGQLDGLLIKAAPLFIGQPLLCWGKVQVGVISYLFGQTGPPVPVMGQQLDNLQPMWPGKVIAGRQRLQSASPSPASTRACSIRRGAHLLISCSSSADVQCALCSLAAGNVLLCCSLWPTKVAAVASRRQVAAEAQLCQACSTTRHDMVLKEHVWEGTTPFAEPWAGMRLLQHQLIRTVSCCCTQQQVCSKHAPCTVSSFEASAIVTKTHPADTVLTRSLRTAWAHIRAVCVCGARAV